MGQVRRGVAAMLAAAAVCLCLSAFGAYAAYAILDADAFADRAVSTLASDELREDLGERMAARLTSTRPELSPGEDVMAHVAAESVAADPAFQASFRVGVLELHHALFDDRAADASLRVAGSGAMLQAALKSRNMGVKIPRLDDVPLLTVGYDPPEQTLRSIAVAADRVALPLSVVLAVLGFALLGAAMLREPDRRRAVWGAGLAVSAAAGLAAAIVTAARDVALDTFDTGFGDAVAGEVWDTYLGDLRLWALAACATGLVAAAAAGGPRPSVAALLAAPASRAGRAARAAGLLAVAALAVQLPELVLHTGLVALAAGLFYVAAGDLLRVLAPPSCAARRLRAAAVAGTLVAVVAVAAI